MYSANAYASMLCRREDISKYFDSTQIWPLWSPLASDI